MAIFLPHQRASRSIPDPEPCQKPQPAPGPWPDSQFTMMTWEAPGGIVLSLGGELDVAVTSELLARVRTLADDGHIRIVMDMRHVTFCDCAGLSALLSAQRIAHDAGGWVRLARIEPPTLRIIALAGLAVPLAGHPSAAAAFVGCG